MSQKNTTYPCPHCQKKVTWRSDNPYRPFCSERCRLIDLGAWANEEYQVPASQESLEDSLDPESDNWHQPSLH
ncbi:DNA gyrase inhibitor YacG [Motiliproteus sediminis]|uniref:DNA gyrase inhibitor YacG n=1 Tax=Motiliproteus sediminis TaxID=1468178 RepID=UPI001AEF92E2|nr:DNA gyrase inhibitor YacG [Motiliproteus sediminis]